MKQIIYFITFICGFTLVSLHAQQYQPIPDSNAAWIIEQDDGFGGLYYHRFSLSPYSDDTVINSKIYTKIYFRFDTSEEQYVGAFRNATDGISYYVPS